jgi:hypothetical protein
MMYQSLFIAVSVAASEDSRNLLTKRGSEPSSESNPTSGNNSIEPPSYDGALGGVVSKKLNNNRLANAENLQWFYNWTPKMSPVTNTKYPQNFYEDATGKDFFAMKWGYDNTGFKRFPFPDQTLLFYNEPDTRAAGGMGSGYCCDDGGHGQLSASSARAMATKFCEQMSGDQLNMYSDFSTPAFSQDPTDTNYLNKCVYPFFEAVKSNEKCRAMTKWFTWHMYTPCVNVDEGAVASFCSDRSSQWQSVMEKVEQDYGFKFEGMYVTEFAGWWQLCVTPSDPKGIQGQAMVARVCTAELKKAPRMRRFAWFNDFGGPTQPGSSDLWNDDDSLSPIGKAYMEALGKPGNPSNGPTHTTQSPMTTGNGFNGSTTESPMTTGNGFNGSTTESPMTTGNGFNGSTTESPMTTGNGSNGSTTESPVPDHGFAHTTDAPTTFSPDSSTAESRSSSYASASTEPLIL